MNISNEIEQLIKELLRGSDGNSVDIQRNELAVKLGCVPSQINYVIQRRFTAEQGYIVESRRGGGGYIRVTRIEISKSDYLMHMLNAIGSKISARDMACFLQNCLDYNILENNTVSLISAATGDNALAPLQNPNRDEVRARIAKNILLALVQNNK